MDSHRLLKESWGFNKTVEFFQICANTSLDTGVKVRNIMGLSGFYLGFKRQKLPAFKRLEALIIGKPVY